MCDRLRSIRAGGAAVAALLLVAGSAGAQDDRDFATPQYWLNAGPADRLPITERTLRWIDGITGPRPPSPKPQGWTPRLSFGLESIDRTGTPGTSDTILTLTPGISYVRRARRWDLAADLTFDASKHFDQEVFTDPVANLSSVAQFVYALSDTNRVSAFAGYSELRDTGDPLLSGFLPDRTVVSSRSTTLAWTSDLSERDSTSVVYSNAHQATDQPGPPDITTNAVTLSYRRNLTPRDALEAVGSYENADFENGTTESIQAVYGRWTRDLGDRLAFQGELGWLGTTAGDGANYPKLGLLLTGTARNARYALEASRNIQSVPGLPSLLLTEQVSVGTHMRLGPGWQLQARAERQLLTGLGPSNTINSQINTVELGLSYAMSRETWLWARLRRSDEKNAGTRERDTRLYLGLSRSFR